MFRFIDSMIHWLKRVMVWLRRVVTQPLEELNRWQMAVRFAYDLSRFGARQMQQDRAHLMAAALAFRTLFGLLPVLVVATVLVKALGLEGQYLEPLGRLFEFWGMNEIQIVPPNGAELSTTLDVWLQERVKEAERVNVTAIGWVGLAVTGYAAISLMVTIENCFNAIYRAPRGRAWSSRVPIYWFLLTLSPLLIIFSTFVDSGFRQLMDSLQARGWVGATLGVMWSLLVIWLLMFAVYALFPNTRVRVQHAMAGALVAAVLLEFGKRTMGIYLQNAMSISQLYGSLGLIPLFMFWVYLMWLAVLFGLQVSAILQHLRGRRLAEMEARDRATAMIEPAMITVLMKQIALGFEKGRGTDDERLADATGVPPAAVEQILGKLAERELIHRLADREDMVSLSCPPESIRLAHLLDIAFAMVDHEVEDGELVEQLRTAQRDSVGNATLQDLLKENA